jgi:hypothetical protein
VADFGPRRPAGMVAPPGSGSALALLVAAGPQARCTVPSGRNATAPPGTIGWEQIGPIGSSVISPTPPTRRGRHTTSGLVLRQEEWDFSGAG